MSQIKPSHLLFFALLALALGGCGGDTINEKAIYNVESGHKSIPDWAGTHKNTFKKLSSNTYKNLSTSVALKIVAKCTECHGEDYKGGISKVSCMSNVAGSVYTCHATSPAANMTGCLSCHGATESGPFGSTAPNTRAAHTTHTSLAGIACSTCHSNGGSGTSDHSKAAAGGGFSKAKVLILGQYTAVGSNGIFGYNVGDKTCSGITCHGGKITPAWTGSIKIVAGDNALCNSCHEKGTTPGKPQYNSYYSGRHAYHLDTVKANCTDCHNINTLLLFDKHFGGVAGKKLVNSGQTVGNGTPTKIVKYTGGGCTTADGCHRPNLPAPFVWSNPQ